MALAGSTISESAVEKAQARARDLGIDLAALSEQSRTASPDALNSRRDQEERRRFLLSLYDGSREANAAFERIIAGNELQQANFLARGALAARPIMRVVIRGAGGRLAGYGTGFLIGDGVLITNNHVLPNSDVAALSEVEAFYEQGIDGADLTVQRYALEPRRMFYTSRDLDFSVVAVAPVDRTGREKLAEIGWLPLVATTGKAIEGEWLTIVQHPKGERKQLCVRENQLIKRDTDVLWYSTDTLPGSSGAAVFNNDWMVVALHHSGVPETKNGQWQTVDGRDYDSARDTEDSVKWIANEGIRVSRIIETLRSDASIADHAMVRAMLGIQAQDISVRMPILFGQGEPPPAKLLTAANKISASGQQPQPDVSGAQSKHLSGETGMSEKLVTVTLSIDENGRASIVGSGPREADFLVAEKEKPKKNVIHAPAEPSRDWISGYNPQFLGTGNLTVPLPQVLNTADIAPLKAAYGQTFTAAEQKAGVLKYDGYSVVMNKNRRFAFFSAANVNWDMRPTISGRADAWLYDDRISRDHQIDDSAYRNNDFDRGHLTRREDMEYGSDAIDATRRANGTCCWPNAVMQHSIFNQDKHPDKTIHLWHGLERYILEETVEQDKFSVQLFTGPIFGAADPSYRGIQYPLEFWKVVVAVTGTGAARKLFATGYILGQKEVIDQFGTEAAKEEPFGNYAMYQRPIRVIEDLTGLKFTYGNGKSLRDIDPLEKPSWRPRRRVRSSESFGGGGDDALESFSEIQLD